MTGGHRPGWTPWKTWWRGDTLPVCPCCGAGCGMQTFVWSAWRPVAWSASEDRASASDILPGATGGPGTTTPQHLSNPVDAAVLALVIGAHQQFAQQAQAEHLHPGQPQHH